MDSIEAHICVVNEYGEILETNEPWNEFAQLNEGLNVAEGANYLDACEQATGDCAASGTETSTAIRQVISGSLDRHVAEYPCHGPNEKRWFQIHVSPLKNENLRGAVIVHTSITERVAAQRELQSATDHLELLSLVAKYTDNAVVITNDVGEIEWVNDGFSRMTGYTLDEVEGKVPGRLLQGRMTDPETIEYMRSQLSNQQGFDVEIINYGKDGAPYWLALEVRPIHGEFGEVVKFIAIESDITERRINQQERERLSLALEERSRMLNAVLQSISEGIIAVDADSNPVCFNKAAQEILGKGECFGIPLSTWPEHYGLRDPNSLAVLSKEQFSLSQAAKGKLSEPQECLVAREDGNRVICLTTLPLQESSKGGAVAVLRDITSEKHNQAEKEELTRQMVDMSRQAGMSEIASGVLHNVGNGLNSVNVSAGLLQIELSKDPHLRKLQKAVSILDENEHDLATFFSANQKGQLFPRVLRELSNRMARQRDWFNEELRSLIDSIDHIKKIVSAQQTYATSCGVTESVRVHDLIDDATKISGVRSSGIEIIQDTTTECGSVVVDRHKVLQILVNLLSNAKQAVTASSSDESWIQITSSVEADMLSIEVTDSGIGITKENLEKVFSHGFTTRKEGHGFGLHHSIISAEELGGKLTARSDGPGTGATFALIVEVQTESESALVSTSAEQLAKV